MSDQIDRDITALEKELAGLRRQKLAELQSQVAALQASLGGEESAADSRPFATTRRKRRGRKLGKRTTDADALAMLRKVVLAAGSDGVSGKLAAQSSGVSYPRAIALMDKHFRKRGSGRWTHYTLK